MRRRDLWTLAVAKRGIKVPRPQGNKWELALLNQMKLAGMETPILQHKFAAPERKFMADFCWPDRRLIVEVEGQVHSIRSQREKDVERRQWCHFNGWTVVAVSNKQVKSGQAIEVVRKALNKEAA